MSTEELDKNSAAGPAKSIQAIDKGSVHRICSGQVVLNLATAVKELVENAVDAGATQIEVKLKEFGSELLEVSDNGSGVEEENFESLTLKHHTSKLTDFSDLVSVDTFGFRGEALSSLCALSDVSVTTRHTSVSVGTKLTYDHNGRLTERSPCPRQCGTTVCLQNLFSTLPVRHKEFKRNLKKEFNKMVQVLQAYCIITKNVRISCNNQCGKGKKSLVLNTNGNDNLKDNITNIFGAKQIQNLIEFKQFEPSEEVCKELGIDMPEKNRSIFSMKGFVSTSQHGQGRSSSDRQYYYINNRPCDPPKISRTVNEVYHQFNRHQYPVVILDISLAKDDVDVNVTPDKRQIFFQNEKLLLAILKSSLKEMFEPESSSYTMNNTPNCLSSMFGKLTKAHSTPPAGKCNDPVSPVRRASFPLSSFSSQPSKSSPSLANLKRSFASAFSKDEPRMTSPTKDKQRKLDGFLSSAVTPLVKESSVSQESVETPSVEVLVLESPDDVLKRRSSLSGTAAGSDDADSAYRSDDLNSIASSEPMSDSQTTVVIEEASDGATESDGTTQFSPEIKSKINISNCEILELDGMSQTTEKSASENDIEIIRENRTKLTVIKGLDDSTEMDEIDSDINCENNSIVDSNSQENNKPVIIDGVRSQGRVIDVKLSAVTESPQLVLDEPEDVQRKTLSLSFNMEKLKERLKARKKAKLTSIEGRKFRAKITPGDNQTAEEELKMQISKDMFQKMDILGQFNLGFIIAKFEKDLFIIDQHATDEKYNFEDLQKNTHIKSQPLIVPQQIGLTAASEEILLDNLEIFRKNGFDFVIDKEAPPTERAKLIAIPMSKDWAFGKDDVDELVFMLSDSPGVLCRPSRVRNMFASRSCRKSIMIGTALNKQEMRKLVDHMGDMDQPWNCPHGRPTLRHLINLDAIAE